LKQVTKESNKVTREKVREQVVIHVEATSNASYSEADIPMSVQPPPNHITATDETVPTIRQPAGPEALSLQEASTIATLAADKAGDANRRENSKRLDHAHEGVQLQKGSQANSIMKVINAVFLPRQELLPLQDPEAALKASGQEMKFCIPVD
jgi:hypothetical protein